MDPEATIKEFRIPVGVLLLFNFFGAVLAFGAVYLRDSLSERPLPPLVLIFAFGGGFAALMIVMVVVLYRFYKVTVFAAGIDGYDALGLTRRVRWEDITHVRMTKIPLIRAAHVTTHRGLLWIPLFLENMSEFRALVSQYAPAENPLRLWLEANP